MHVLGLHGRMFSGKDTTFELMREEGERVGLRVERIAFADYLKVSAAVALGGLGEDPEDLSPEGRKRLVEATNDFKETGSVCVISSRKDGSTYGKLIDGRKFLQVYGTEAHRKALDSPNFWIDALLKNVQSVEDLKEYFLGVDILVVTDVRFDNEAEVILALDTEPLDRRIRLGNTTIARVTRGPADPILHASEAGISDDLVDYEIDNSGTLDDLRNEVSVLLIRMVGEKV